jgi:glutathione synthase/RimK-type ligase-like ATP-grasp enzyme
MDSFIPQNNILNKKRFFVEAINKAAQEQGIETNWMSGDWICRLQKGDTHHFIYGYNFPLNSSTVWEVARDKTGASMLLSNAKIPCVVHELFMAPNLSTYISKDGNWNRIIELSKEWKFPLVCKDNRGTGGNSVYKVHTQQDLEIALEEVWKVARGAALSPFCEIENEYRFFVLDGEVELAYKKVIPHIVGDGVSTVLELMKSQIKSQDTQSNALAEQDSSLCDWSYIPKENEKYSIGWKFNLSKGGTVEMINIDDFPQVIEIVMKTVKELNLRICSVDIIKLKNSNDYLVLEVNTGISTEHFSKNSSEARQMAEALYSKILFKLFQ